MTVTRENAALPGSTSEVVVSMTYESDGEPVPEEYRGGFYTVEGLFGLLRWSIEVGADSVEVDFDPALGYPRDVLIDLDRGTADEELIYSFELLEPADGPDPAAPPPPDIR